MKKHLIVVACTLVLIGLAVVLPAAAADGMGESGSAFERSAHMNIATDPVPAIDIQARTNGQDADTPPGPSVPVGSTVHWTYLVMNTGNVALTNIIVTDDQGVTVTAPGESMTATAAGTAQAGQYANIGTVTADPPTGPTVTASDPSHYFGTSPPVAAFTADPTSGVAPLTVQINDTSTGDGIMGRSWDFDNDGTVDSTERDPAFIFTVPGTYPVNLTVTNAGGSDSETRPGCITVLQNLPPVGGDKGYFLVSIVPPGADISLEGRDGTRYLKGNTSAGPLNVTLGTGFSETHPDADGDGFCDEPSVDASGAVDHLPLALPPAVATVPGGAGLPADTDGDGVLDDVNGNGWRDFADIVLYFNRRWTGPSSGSPFPNSPGP